MTQLVFIHGPGAGGCADSYANQLRHYPGSLAPHLPGHLDGTPCSSVERYTDWLRGWLHAKGHDHDLVLSGFTLGACIALQYALDYPEEVKGLALMTIAMRPKQRHPGALQFRLDAADNPETYEKWVDMMDGVMHFVEPDLRASLLQRHREVGPVAQYRDLVVIDRFDVRDRIHSLQDSDVVDSRRGRPIGHRRLRRGNSPGGARLQTAQDEGCRPFPDGGKT